MKIYLDLVFLVNFGFDLLLLLTLKIVLKKNTTIKRILLGALLGGLSIFFLFLPLNTVTLFILKIIISLIMIRVSYPFTNIKTYLKDILYLYFISIILGGFLYYLNLEFSYKNTGLVFFHNGFSINYILLIILSPIILYLYIKQNKYLRKINATNYIVTFTYKNKEYTYNAYLDTGNKLYDPYKKRPVILLYDSEFNIGKNEKIIYVPYKTLEHNGVIPCIIIKNIVIDNKIEVNNVLVGISKKEFKIDGISIILHPDIFDN